MSAETIRYAYYPGCSLHSTAKEYDLSFRAVMAATGIELVEVPDWNCCGASSAHATDPFLAFALPARVLIQAEAVGLDVVAPCAACYGRLVATLAEARRHPAYVDRLERAVGRRLRGTVRVLNVLEVLGDPRVADAIRVKVVRPLTGLSVAAYYGCLLVRPPKLTKFDDTERPETMDRLIELCGATAVDYPHKTECCGAGLGISRTELVAELVGRILAAAKRDGAQALAVACPLCQTNLDSRQDAAGARQGESFHLPVYYITQLVGLALGLEPAKLGLGRHLVDTMGLLREKKLA